MALILKALIKVPLNIIKNLCETGDFNVFLASLPYKIAKPITLALMNQIPMWATPEYIKNAPPKSPENAFGFPEDPLAALKRSAYFLPVSGFTTIPIIGAALLWAFIIPSPFGIAYYALGCWYDTMVDNANMDIAQDAAATKLLEGKGIVVDKCNIAKMRKMQSKPEVDRSKLLETEYV